jgi:2'-5' RNA ligase
MRTFIAIEFDQAILRRLESLQNRLEPHCPKMKWADPSKIHLTLKFLGEINDSQMTAVSQALDQLAGQCQPFDIAVENLGTFKPAGPLSVVWVGIQDPSNRLAECQDRCEQLLEPLGFPPEKRRFSPHLTIARNRLPKNSRQIRAALDAEPPFQAGVQTVTSLTFYRSTLTSQGPIYNALGRHSFPG